MEEREHITDMPYCWCNPRKEVQPNGDMIIIHNYDDMETNLEQQIDRLADYIMKEFPLEIKDGGAVDVAIEIMKKYKASL